MCGIIGYTGQRPAGAIILDGLRRLEYRGYDSAGLALFEPGHGLFVQHATGKLDALVQRVEGALPPAVAGIGHTRWATHGEPNDRNAHPQLDPDGRVAVVHNGIIENFAELRARYARGVFRSDTDTEVLSHMLAAELEREIDLLDALRHVVSQAEGAYSIVAIDAEQPGRIVAARVGNAGGIVAGIGEHEHLLASDLGALLPHTRNVVFVEPGELVDMTADDLRVVTMDAETVEKVVEVLPYDPVSAAKGPYKHFMLKEIFEQPDAVLDTMRGRYVADPPHVNLEELGIPAERLREIDRVVLIGMGTSVYSAMVGRHYLERFAHLPSEVDDAAEFCYREPVLDEQTLVISISQSGETVDTLTAMEQARRAGSLQITLCNTPGAQTTRVADGALLMRVGPEIAVASTKTMVASMVLLHALSLWLGRARGVIDEATEAAQVTAALHLPAAIGQALERAASVEALASRYAHYDNFLYLGRGLGYPVALEGALKLKEVAYIHAEGYSAGQMKHGPIALIDEQMPTLAVAPRDDVFDKMRSNIEQLRARRGPVIAVVSHQDGSLGTLANDVIELPPVDAFVAPVVTVVPLQLFAYYIATRRGADVDQPRNLAKTVTVE